MMPGFCRRTAMLIPVLAFFISCGEAPDADRRPVARVGENFLYEDELREMMPLEISGADSLEMVRKFIESWAKEMVVLQKAEKNLEELSDIERKIRDYRKSLVIYAYEKALVTQNLDTNVTDQEIETYYREHPESYTLKDNIIKVTYVKVDKKAPDISKVRKWYKSEDAEDRQKLVSYVSKNNVTNFYIDDSWLLFDDLLKEIPIKLYDKESFLQYNRFIEHADTTHFYFVNIRGFRIKNTLSPLSFEKDNIRHAIINKRKLELIGKIKNDLYNDALNQEQVEIFVK